MCVCVCLRVCSVAKSCLTPCNLMACSPPGSSVHGILQARILEWIATSFHRGFSQPRDGTRLSCVSFIGRQILYHLCHPGSPRESWDLAKLQGQTPGDGEGQGSLAFNLSLIWSPAAFKLVYVLFAGPHHSLSLPLLSGTTICSKFILHFP